MNTQPRAVGQADSMVELDELLNQLSDVPGPSPEQVAILDHALEPYLGVISVGAPSAGAHQSIEGAGASIDAAGQGAAASHTGLVSGKLLGVVGGVVIVGTVLWGAAQFREPNQEARSQTSAGAARQSSAVTPHDNGPGDSRDSHLESVREVQPEPVHVNTPSVNSGEHTLVSRTSSDRGSRDATRTKPAATERSALRAAREGGLSRTSDDWAQELQRLERAEVALKGGHVDAALALLQEVHFSSLHLNARALEAAALCSGSTTQRQRGAALARKLAENEHSAVLVRRLKGCISHD